ncbi:MAG TPA: amidohydrolase [Clostridia bacterium]|nr:amidohydrolase [Clostridia bacterium]
MKTLIKNINILTVDENSNQYQSGCILIDGHEITFVGYERDLGVAAGTDIDIVEDGRGMLAIPGLVNSHTHTAMTLFRGYANDLPLMKWLEEKIWPAEDRLAQDDVYWLSLLAISEMIKGGVTAFADMYMFMEQTALSVLHSGIRGVLARGLQGPDQKSRDRLEENRILWENWHGEGDGRIRVMVGPHGVYTCEPSYLAEVLELAHSLGTGIHIHLSETRQEVENCIKEYGKSPVMHLNDLGLLGGNTLAAHCVHLSSEDLDVLKDRDVKIVHCPISNLKLGSGIAPVHEMLSKGIAVSLGTDGAASNNNLSIMKEMAFAALISKGVKEDATLISAATALKMATNHGAGALGLEDEIGSISPGKKADIVLVDTGEPHYHPHGDWTTHLVYSGHSGDVDSVWVNGKRLMKNKALLTIDSDKVYSKVRSIYKRVMGSR